MRGHKRFCSCCSTSIGSATDGSICTAARSAYWTVCCGTSSVRRGFSLYSYLTKLFAAGFLALSCWGTRSVRSERITHRQILLAAAAGLLLFFFGDPLRHLPPQWAAPLYVAATSIGFLSLFLAGLWLGRLVKERLREDPFNDENESFMQETRLIENEYSVNLRSRYYYGKAWHEGWINAVNPFRATIVLGTPGSGKSYTVVNSSSASRSRRASPCTSTTSNSTTCPRSLQPPFESPGRLRNPTEILHHQFRRSPSFEPLQSHRSGVYDRHLGRLRIGLHDHAQPQ